jgi:uncharacterized metal-binding protein YceD (DUF177 family)
MNINLAKLVQGKPFTCKYEGMIEADLLTNMKPLLALKNINVHINILLVDEILTISFTGNIIATLECSYSLSHFDKKLPIDETFEISLDDNDTEMDHLLDKKSNDINLDEYLLAAIKTAIPMVVVKPGTSLPKGDKDYRVLTEKELEKEKAESYDPRFDKLKDIDL